MCGIAGFIQKGGALEAKLQATAQKMGAALTHRGPDDEGVWVDPERGLAFAHRRLSILDLSSLGHQPYLSDDGQYVLSYNGEIYNFKEIAKDLSARGCTFKSHSDTEVLLNALIEWGVKGALERLNGMFAFAFYDRKQNQLYLARDRMGVKPLYWSLKNNLCLFASELKAFHQHPDFSSEINRNALSSYFQLGYMTRDHSIYKDVHQLEPGHYVGIDVKKLTISAAASWWDVPLSPSTGHSTLNLIHENLKQAVALRMVADVPVGVMLSGGIDSSLVTALMQAQSTNPVKSFSIGFEEAGYNEAPHAEKIAAHLRTDHQTLTLKAKEVQELIPTLSHMYDEPFGDSSALPSLILSKLIREHVTVALSGDGGDEVFLGYNRYAYFDKLQAYRKLPRFIRELSGGFLSLLPTHTRLKDKISKFTTAGLSKDLSEMYTQIFGGWPASLVNIEADSSIENPPFEDVRALQYLDYLHYLPGDIMTKVDRATMAYSLEARNPFLDVNVVESAHNLPMDLKLNGGVTKYALRQILSHYVPKPLFERPKAGFAIPLCEWLRGDLRDWADSLLNDADFRALDFLDHRLIISAWHDFLKGRDVYMHRIWTMLMFISWMKTYKK